MGVHHPELGREDSVKKNRYTATQIVGMLREAEALLSTGKTIEEVCRHLGIAESSYYRWRAEYNGIQVDQVTRMKELEEENRRLKKMYAEAQLSTDLLKEALSKKW